MAERREEDRRKIAKGANPDAGVMKSRSRTNFRASRLTSRGSTVWNPLLHEFSRFTRELWDRASRDGSDSDRRSGIRRTKTREEQLLFVSDKRAVVSGRDGEAGVFLLFQVCSVRFTVRSCSPLTFILGELIALGHTHSTTAGTRTIAPNDACCQKLLLLPCLHCPRVRHVFAPRQTKALGTSNGNGIATSAI